MFNIVSKKKVIVSDIKQYLVDEFKKTNNQEKQIEELKDKIKKCIEIEIKYNTTLVTLDEYRKRVENKEKRIIDLEKQFERLQNKLKAENDLKNDEIIKYKKLESLYDKLKSESEKEIEKRCSLKMEEYKKSKIEIIKNTKGNISKKQVIDVLSKN